jgi:hypothetical protein
LFLVYYLARITLDYISQSKLNQEKISTQEIKSFLKEAVDALKMFHSAYADKPYWVAYREMFLLLACMMAIGFEFGLYGWLTDPQGLRAWIGSIVFLIIALDFLRGIGFYKKWQKALKMQIDLFSNNIQEPLNDLNLSDKNETIIYMPVPDDVFFRDRKSFLY